MGAQNAIWNVVARSPAAFSPEAPVGTRRSIDGNATRIDLARCANLFSACALRSMARPQRLRDWPNIGPLIAYRIGSLTAPRPTPVHDSTRTVLSTERRGRKHAEGYARTTLDHLVPVRVVAAPMARMVVRTKFLSLETRASNTVASYLYMHHFARLTVWHDLPCRSQGAWSGGSLRSQPPTR
jgi:hypothetical protein